MRDIIGTVIVAALIPSGPVALRIEIAAINSHPAVLCVTICSLITCTGHTTTDHVGVISNLAGQGSKGKGKAFTVSAALHKHIISTLLLPSTVLVEIFPPEVAL